MELVAGQLRIQEGFRKILVMRAKRSVDKQIVKFPCVPGGLPDYSCVRETPGDPASLERHVNALPLNVFLTFRIAKTKGRVIPSFGKSWSNCIVSWYNAAALENMLAVS